MRNRLMAGHIPLEDGILVRIQAPQQNFYTFIFWIIDREKTRVA